MKTNTHIVPFFTKTDLKVGLNQLGLRNASEALFTSSLFTRIKIFQTEYDIIHFTVGLLVNFIKIGKVLLIRNSINISAILSTYWLLFIPEYKVLMVFLVLHTH